MPIQPFASFRYTSQLHPGFLWFRTAVSIRGMLPVVTGQVSAHVQLIPGRWCRWRQGSDIHCPDEPFPDNFYAVETEGLLLREQPRHCCH